MRPDRLILQLILLTLLTISNLKLYGQQEINQDWNAFAQSFDITSYQGGEFRFKAFVRTEDLSTNSHAQLWARIDATSGKGFFDNMHQRPITSNQWKDYVIEGAIDNTATKLTIGGIGQGAGKYYFDNFTLEIKTKEGSWEKIVLTNSGFEEGSFLNDWKSYHVKGFTLSRTTVNVLDGKYSLFLNSMLTDR